MSGSQNPPACLSMCNTSCLLDIYSKSRCKINTYLVVRKDTGTHVNNFFKKRNAIKSDRSINLSISIYTINVSPTENTYADVQDLYSRCNKPTSNQWDTQPWWTTPPIVCFHDCCSCIVFPVRTRLLWISCFTFFSFFFELFSVYPVSTMTAFSFSFTKTLFYWKHF